MKERKTLRQLMEEGPVFAPCTFDCLTAKIVEDVGFTAQCLSGSSVSASFCGCPDIGLVSLEDLTEIVSRVTAVSPLPMIVDIDTGFGTELNTMRTCERIAAAGAMAVHLEDQTFPKRCGHLGGKEIIPREDYFRKIKAAADALKGTDCMLIARTDSYHKFGVEEAIARNLGALEMGADITFTEGTGTVRDIERVAKEVPGWKMFDMLVKGASPKVPYEDLIAYGYRLITVPAISTGGATIGIGESALSAKENKNDIYAVNNDWTIEKARALMDGKMWADREKAYGK